jgi:hypothetical protein
MYSDSLSYSVAAERLKAELEILKAELGTRNSALDPANAADEAEAMASQRAVKPWWRRLLRSAKRPN